MLHDSNKHIDERLYVQTAVSALYTCKALIVESENISSLNTVRCVSTLTTDICNTYNMLLQIEGTLLNPPPLHDDSQTKFSSFFESVLLQLQEEAFPDGNMYEWHVPYTGTLTVFKIRLYLVCICCLFCVH
jgi:hypothetical protein